MNICSKRSFYTLSISLLLIACLFAVSTYDSFAQQPSTGSQLQHKLFIDYDCDGDIDVTKNFNTSNEPMFSGESRIVPLNVRADTPPIGDHCFAFKVDTSNKIEETNERNNQTEWKEFTTGTASPGVPQTCREYMPPQCNADEHIEAGEPLENGCASAAICVPNTDIPEAPTSDAINLEIKVYQQSETAGVPVYTLRHDWTSEDVEIERTDRVQIRWDATAYAGCFINLHPLRYDFSTQIATNFGNTETSNHPLRTVDGSYSIECSNGSGHIKKEISTTFAD